jgi:hypothetical protein
MGAKDVFDEYYARMTERYVTEEDDSVSKN